MRSSARPLPGNELVDLALDALDRVVLLLIALRLRNLLIGKADACIEPVATERDHRKHDRNDRGRRLPDSRLGRKILQIAPKLSELGVHTRFGGSDFGIDGFHITGVAPSVAGFQGRDFTLQRGIFPLQLSHQSNFVLTCPPLAPSI